MKYLLLILLSANGFKSLVANTDNFNIEINVDGISNDNAVLAYYYMDKKYIKDTIAFDENGVGRISGEQEINTGVYLLAFPSLNLRYFELLLGEETKFTLTTDTTDFIGNMKVEGSLENQLFYDNMRYLIKQGQASGSIRNALAETEEGSKEYNALINDLTDMEDEVHKRRNKLIKLYPDAFYTQLIKAMMELKLPENPNPTDSSYAYKYYHEHYFDNIDFSDNRLARTPFLLRKILTFLDDYTIPIPDSINAAAEMIIEKSRVNDEMFQFCLVGIFNKYAKSKVMAHELVYVNLAKKYYLSGLADWVDEEQFSKFQERLAKMEPTLLGKITPQIIISDIEGKVRRLHEEAATHDYTILVFWNSSCGHCRKEVPRLKEVFDAEISAIGNLAVFAVSTEVETDEWLKFVEENSLKNEKWIHSHDPYGRNPFRVQYDVESTPIIIVLNRESKILAKRIGIDDIKPLIEFDIVSGESSNN